MGLKKIGISIDEEIYERVKAEVATRDYRNVSHFMERAAELLLNERLKGRGQNPCEASATP